MAFGDILAGLAEAGHQHRTTLLQMDYEKKRDLASMYGKLAQDPNYPEEARTEFLNRAVQIHTLPAEKKLPKEWENMQITVQPPTPPPAQVSATDGAMGPTPQMQVDMPKPPAQQRNVMAPMPFSEQLDRQSQTARAASQVKTDTELREVQQRHAFLQQQFPGLPETSIAAMATGHPAPSMSFSIPGTISGTDAKTLSPIDAGGQPIAEAGHYSARMMNGQWVITPVEAKTSGGVKFGVGPDGKPVAFSTDQYGKVQLHPEVDITPVQMLPTTTISSLPRIVPQADGTYALEMVPSQTTRTRGGVSAPTPPPNMAAPNAGGGGTSAAPTTPATTIAGKRTMGAKSLTPGQIQDNDAKTQSFDNMISRMTGVMEKADLLNSLWTTGKIAFAIDPANPRRLMLSRAAGLSDAEAKFAADYVSLGEDINLLRGVFQATGFRGPEAFATQQAQRGPLLGDPKLFKNVLQNSLRASVDQLSSINRAMTNAGRPTPLTDGLMKAFLLLNQNNVDKAFADMKRNGWPVE